MSRSEKLHLVERAAERLIRDGGAPAGLAAPPAPAAGVTPPPGIAAGSDGSPAPAGVEHLAPAPVGPIEPAEAQVSAALRPAAEPAVLPRGMLEMSRLIAAGLAEGGGRSRVAEEFRLVQHQILRAAFGSDGGSAVANLVMVTSARPNEGKTFTALNLAASVARRGDHRVLLVDADAKHGSLTDLLQLSDRPGLLEIASDPALDVGRCLIGAPIPALSVLPVGRQRGHRGDLFASNSMLRLIQELGQRYTDRLVVLDVAPCLSTSDPAALAAAVGQVLFVVEAERTQRDEVEAALDLIQTCPTITLLLNKVQMSTSHSFGAYSYAYSS
jgi:protein-tyrosine kinase